MKNMTNLWEKFLQKFFQYAPSCVVCLNFLPSGFIFGYTICSFVAERNANAGLIEYGPLILGACWGFITALAMCAVKFFRGRIVLWHFHLLLFAGVFNLIASCFYFANGFDQVGAFISYVAHSVTFLAGFSFLHAIASKGSRAILLSTCGSFYLLGIASAVSLIGTSYSKNIEKYAKNATGITTQDELIDGIYVDFAATYLCVSIVMLVVLIGLKVLSFIGIVDTENSMDNDFRIANSNGSIFDKRAEVIKRIQFFYVTKNQQWNITLLLIFTEAVQYALFIYLVFWFSINNAMRLTDVGHIDAMFWVIFGGSVLATICLIFISVKVNFVALQLCLIILTVLSMIICSAVQTTVTFWLILLFFGMAYTSLQIALIEVTHLRYTELAIYASYLLKLLSTGIVSYYFVSNEKNSYFYSTDESTLMAQGFVYIIITALLALVVGMKVPRTHRTPIMDIQYEVYGIIFMKHQIEQLNVRWLNDGTIPTISQPAAEQ